MKIKEIRDTFKISNLETEQSISKKLSEILNEYGRIYYKIIEHEHINTYRELNLMTKKLLINKLDNCIVLIDTSNKINLYAGVFRKLVSVDAMVSKDYIDTALQNYDLKMNTMSRTTRNASQNMILDGKTRWIKLYTDKDCECEINLSQFSRLDIRRYFKDKLVQFAINNKINLPSLVFDENIGDNLYKLHKRFNDNELKYLDINIL